MSIERRQRGISLVELILFIVIVGVAVAGVLAVMNTSVQASGDPLVRKQAIAIAESLLTEVEQQAFTWCDPQDIAVTTASGPADCGAGSDQDNGGGALVSIPAGTESRGSATQPFDNVADYTGYGQTPPTDIEGANPLAGYTSAVTITRAGGAAPFGALPAGAVLRIAVRVTGPGGTDVTVVGYRTRHAPRAPG